MWPKARIERCFGARLAFNQQLMDAETQSRGDGRRETHFQEPRSRKRLHGGQKIRMKLVVGREASSPLKESCQGQIGPSLPERSVRFSYDATRNAILHLSAEPILAKT